jgi:hypothetical protein
MPRTKPPTPPTEFDFDALGPKAAAATKNLVERIRSRCHAFSADTGYDLCEISSTISPDHFTDLLEVLCITRRSAQRCMGVARADAKCDPLHMLEQMPNLLPEPSSSSPDGRRVTISAIKNDDSPEANVGEASRHSLKGTDPKAPRPVAVAHDAETHQRVAQQLIVFAPGIEDILRQRRGPADKPVVWAQLRARGNWFDLVRLRSAKRYRKSN